ncbi:MAG: ornithine carbamoyltransferase [Deltaproteobacteria bacterium]|nr:ornithine carbamoyltransferase [Deltaproteobacteria bacterium]
MATDLLTLLELSPDQIKKILLRAAFLKKSRKKGRLSSALKGKTLAMIFEKPSTRTKVSFDVAMYEMGGHTVSLDNHSSQLGRGESYEDTGRVLSQYVHGIVMRTFGQKNIEELAKGASVPVINGLSDLYHPCQTLTDLLTVQEEKGKLAKARVCYVGDGNNVANSWILASMILGFELRVATPKGYEPSAMIFQKVNIGKTDSILLTNDPVEAVKGADVINTDTWFSMGQEVSDEKRKAFLPYQVNQELLKKANKDAIVLHCLPAHRGEEITNDVMDGPQSRVLQQAENRLHVQKAILEMFLK